jgi:hypothetical protein
VLQDGVVQNEIFGRDEVIQFRFLFDETWAGFLVHLLVTSPGRHDLAQSLLLPLGILQQNRTTASCKHRMFVPFLQ